MNMRASLDTTRFRAVEKAAGIVGQLRQEQSASNPGSDRKIQQALVVAGAAVVAPESGFRFAIYAIAKSFSKGGAHLVS